MVHFWHFKDQKPAESIEIRQITPFSSILFQVQAVGNVHSHN